MPRDALLELVILLALVVLPFFLRHISTSRALLWLASAILLSAGMLWLSRSVERDSNGPSAFSLPAWMHFADLLLSPFYLLLVLVLAAASALHPVLHKRKLKFFYAGLGMIVLLAIGIEVQAFRRLKPPEIDINHFDPRSDLKSMPQMFGPFYAPVSKDLVAECVLKEPAAAGRMPLFEVTLHNSSHTSFLITDEANLGTGITRDISFFSFDSQGRESINRGTKWNTAFPPRTLASGESLTFDFPNFPGARAIQPFEQISHPSLKKPGRYAAFIELGSYRDRNFERIPSTLIHFDMPGF